MASLYDANGRLKQQKIDNNLGTQTSALFFEQYDGAGNLIQYSDKKAGTTTVNSLDRYEGYVVSSSKVTGGSKAGTTTQAYDVNGQLASVTDGVTPANNRTVINDAQGRTLWVNQGGNVLRELVIDGQSYGRHGVGPDPITPKDENHQPKMTSEAELSFGYQGINGNYPGTSPGRYTVQPGDTLQSIARSAYGDSQLWYRIAEANGLASNADLKAGQALNIPIGVGGAHHDSATASPYDPSRIVGDTAAHLPAPSHGGACGGMGQVLMVVVAIAVTFATQGAAASMWGGVFGQGSLAASVAGSATAAAVGSVASQAVGIAIGQQEGFSWKQVGLAAIGGGVTAGLPATVPGFSANTLPNLVARAALSNAVSQGIGVVTGLQDHFSWRGVAASAVGAGVGQAVGGALGMNEPGFSNLSFGEQFGARLATGLAAGTAAAVMRGGKISIQQVAVDAFGNALGESILANSQSGVDWSMAPDESAAETARLGRYQAAATDGAWDRHVAGPGTGGGMSEADYWNSRGPTMADRYADTFGGDADLVDYRTRSGKVVPTVPLTTLDVESDRRDPSLDGAFPGEAPAGTVLGYRDKNGPYFRVFQDGNVEYIRPTGSGESAAQVVTITRSRMSEAEKAAYDFQAANDARVAAGTYDRFGEIGSAFSDGRYGDIWRHATFVVSSDARAVLDQRLNPAPTAAQLRFQTDIGLAVAGPLTGWAAGARMLGASDEVVNKIGVAQAGLVGSFAPAVLGRGSVVGQPTWSTPIGPRGVPSLGDLDAAMASRVTRYAEVVNSNKPWTWREVDNNIPQADRRLIRSYAEQAGLVQTVPVDPVTRIADFSKVAIRQDSLPETYWGRNDRAQFDYLDTLIGGRPIGTTWHHDVAPGNMQLVPFGVHNITPHVGGRTIWSLGPR